MEDDNFNIKVAEAIADAVTQPKFKEMIIEFANATSHKAACNAIDEYEKRIDKRLESFGFDTHDSKAHRLDMIHLRRFREGSEETAKIVKKVAVGAFISGVIFLLVQGFSTFKIN